MKKSIYFIVGWFAFITMYSCSILENIAKEVKYRTLFKPNPQALDTFSAPEIVIPINNE